MTSPIHVLIVEDSAFMRHALTKHLEADPNIQVVGAARDGLDALEQIKALKPDVVTLDIEMPRMDGLTALKRIMAECPTPVVMLSAFTQRGARATIQGLMRGAVDFVPKPDTNINIHSVIQELIAKIKIAATMPVAPGAARAASSAPPHIPTPERASVTRMEPRSFRKGDPVIVIGASTGGPRALQEVLTHLPAEWPAAVALVQHMPPSFTRALAQRLNEISPLVVREAEEGDYLARGLALMAPGDYHMTFEEHNRVRLNQEPRRNGVRPALDVSMETAAAQHGSAVIGVVLTGMGSDGTSGARHIKAAGGRIIAEAQSTSAVYGMPRSVVEAGLADLVVPLDQVAATLIELVRKG